MDNALIIFVRNLEAGRVKTRLAATIGDANALKVYQILLDHTWNVVKILNCHKYIFYADLITVDDQWHGDDVFKKIQSGDDLGIRMKNAFAELFMEGYEKVMIIGSDCYELSSKILVESFNLLSENDVVIGPAIDGGYYLLGMKKTENRLFDDKRWSTSTVFKDTLRDINDLRLTYALLPMLNDVDEETDITFPF